MNLDKWICGCAAIALIFTAMITSKACGEGHAGMVKQAGQSSHSLRSLSPQPEPPDRKKHQPAIKKGVRNPHSVVSLGPQPEPPDQPIKKSGQSK